VSEDRDAGAFEDHMTAAENFLAIAEDEFTRFHEQPSDDGSTPLSAKLDDAVALAELHRKMAETYASAPCMLTELDTTQRPAADATRAVREQLAADLARERDEVLTAESPEPESSPGDLWIDTEREPKQFRYLYRLGEHDWLWCNHHAEALAATSASPWHTALDGVAAVRRPTDSERAAFYAPLAAEQEAERWLTRPVPDGEGGQVDASATETPCDCCASGLVSGRTGGPETCDDCGHSAERHEDRRTPAERAAGVPAGAIPVRHVQAAPPPIQLDQFTNPQGTSLADLGDEELASLVDAIRKGLFERGKVLRFDASAPAGHERPWKSGGGAGQWNG
jgi:hypothetical protein